jgi:hypothetical protein
LPRDDRISLKQGNKNDDLRLATVNTKDGEKIIMRVFDPSSLQSDLGSLVPVGRGSDGAVRGAAHPAQDGRTRDDGDVVADGDLASHHAAPRERRFFVGDGLHRRPVMVRLAS